MKANIRSNQKAHVKALVISSVVIAAAVSLLAAPNIARGQLYVSTTSGVGEYDATTGAAINSGLVTSQLGAMVAVSGNDLWASGGAGSWYNPPVTDYTVWNGSVTSSTTFSLSHWNVRGIAVSGNTLYADYNAANGTDSIGLFNATTGAAINNSFITGLPVDATRNLELVGNVLYVPDNQVGCAGIYDATTGAAINSSLVSGLGGASWGSYFLTVQGNRLYIANYGSGTIGEYDATTGATINPSFISGLTNPDGVAVLGNNLYVANHGGGTIGEYDATTGATINPSLISGLSSPLSLVVVPEPSAFVLVVLGGTGMALLRRRTGK